MAKQAKNMVKYIIKRIFMIFPMLITILVITWLLSYSMLINPVLNDLGMVRDRDIYDLEMERLGLNDPWFIQLGNYFRDFFTGNWGKSYTDTGGPPGLPVFEIIYTIFPKTVELMIVPIILIPIIAVKLGVVSAKNRNKSKDIIIRYAAIFAAGFPSFWIAGLLKYFFGISLRRASLYQFDIDIEGSNNLVSSAPTIVPTQIIGTSIFAFFLFLFIGIILIYIGIKFKKREKPNFEKQGKMWIYVLFGLGGIILFTILLFFSYSSLYISFLIIEFLVAFTILTVYGILSKTLSKNLKKKKYVGIYLTISGLIIGIIGAIPVVLYFITYGTQFRIIDSILFNEPLYLWDTLGHLFLPILSLTFVSLAGITRLTRSSMLDVLNQDYIRTARAKGVPEKQVINRHALRNALIPTSNLIIGGTAAALLGSVFIENVFNYRGFGYTLFSAIWDGDIPVINGCILFATIIILIGNLVADVMYTIIDPRIIYT